MIGDPAGAHPRRSHTGLGVVVAALGLVLPFVVIRYGLLPTSLPFALLFALPPLFWLSLLALGSIGLVAHVARRERARARARRDAPAGPNLEEEPQLRPNALDEPEPAPEVMECEEDWVRLPADDGEVRPRVLALAARTALIGAPSARPLS